jgi:hypothetical protein
MHLHLVPILLITACILSSTLGTLLWVIGGVLVVLGMLVNLQSPQGGLLVVLGVCVLVSTAGGGMPGSDLEAGRGRRAGRFLPYCALRSPLELTRG